jgi:hypothetical protein
MLNENNPAKRRKRNETRIAEEEKTLLYLLYGRRLPIYRVAMQCSDEKNTRK